MAFLLRPTTAGSSLISHYLSAVTHANFSHSTPTSFPRPYPWNILSLVQPHFEVTFSFPESMRLCSHYNEWALDSDRSTLKSHDLQQVSSFFMQKKGMIIPPLGEDSCKNYMRSHVNALRWSIRISFPFTTQIALWVFESTSYRLYNSLGSLKAMAFS